MGWEAEVSAGQRFEFGKNWRRYLANVHESQLSMAKASLVNMLGEIRGKTFLDVGSGSGLLSLAAVHLGAVVHSFDYDPVSVECTRELKRRFAPERSDWVIAQASVLDRAFLERLGQFDVTYSWGVLHHTGNMSAALENVASLVRPSGQLCISIYNDQGETSHIWKLVKRIYNNGMLGKFLILASCVPFLTVRSFAADVVRMRNPLSRYWQPGHRGMAALTDTIDWLGGWPFEVAKPEQIVQFYLERGFMLRRLRTCAGRSGCNEFLFTRHSCSSLV